MQDSCVGCAFVQRRKNDRSRESICFSGLSGEHSCVVARVLENQRVSGVEVCGSHLEVLVFAQVGPKVLLVFPLGWPREWGCPTPDLNLDLLKKRDFALHYILILI